MVIFLSWSKHKSREIAFATKSFFEGLFRNSVEIWMSSESITYGSMSMLDINNALKKSDKCLAFITSDNINSPWIMYETGAISVKCYSDGKSKKENAVIPIIFDDIPKSEFLGHPLNQFQRLTFNKESMKRLVIQLDSVIKAFSSEKTLNQQFNLNWNELNKEIRQILQKYSLKTKGCVTSAFLVEALEKNNFPTPNRGKVIKYEHGFETQKLYEILLNNADKRFYVFGRKNRKLFSTENRIFFQDLKRRIKNGFDFKCLFIDPNSKNVITAQRGENFSKKLSACLYEAREVLSTNGINPEEVCRFYSCERTEQIIIIDNAVVYSPVTYSDDNYPLPLTKASFYVLDIENPIGQNCYRYFENTWKQAKPFRL